MTELVPLEYICVRCRKSLTHPNGGRGSVACSGCGMEYEYDERYFRYAPDELLFNRFKRKYLLNKVLNNNGALSYELLKEGSLSLPDRADVKRFGAFLARHARPGRLLDVGCGPLELPGYLQTLDSSQFELVGLDPIDSRAFAGTRIVGCSEFIPLPDGSIDTLVFGTSLDHACSVEQTLSESVRVLKGEGKLVMWMSDRSMPWFKRLFVWLKGKVKNLIRGYRTDRYTVYPGWIVFYTPSGAVDPFHAFRENPKQVIAELRKLGMELEEMTVNSRDEVHASLIKRTPRHQPG